jgi:hypothetical protein
MIRFKKFLIEGIFSDEDSRIDEDKLIDLYQKSFKEKLTDKELKEAERIIKELGKRTIIRRNHVSFSVGGIMDEIKVNQVKFSKKLDKSIRTAKGIAQQIAKLTDGDFYTTFRRNFTMGSGIGTYSDATIFVRYDTEKDLDNALKFIEKNSKKITYKNEFNQKVNAYVINGIVIEDDSISGRRNEFRLSFRTKKIFDNYLRKLEK